MSDPRRIVGVIDDLAGELDRWSMMSREVLASADRDQATGTQECDATGRRQRIENDNAIQMRSAVEESDDLVLTAQRHAQEALAMIDDRLVSIARALRYCEELLEVWQGELDLAQQWKERADERVAQARNWVRMAEAAVATAQTNLSRAQAALRRCKSDQNRRNCNSEVRDVGRAEAVVAAALADLAAAQSELSAALEELQLAEARVACCVRAVGRATEALAECVTADGKAREAENEAHHGIPAADSALQSVRRAEAANEQHFEVAEEMLSVANRARGHLDTATAALRNAHGDNETAGRHAADARRDLQTRSERLRAFDRSGGL